MNVREVLNAIFYVLSTGCQWKALPKDLPPKSTAHSLLWQLWDWDGTLERIHHALYVETRERAGREASPTASDHRQPERERRSKRGSALDPQGFDAGKKITGRKRHILVDTLGLFLSVVVHPADIQDRDGAGAAAAPGAATVPVHRTHLCRRRISRGHKMAKVVGKTGSWKMEIVKRCDIIASWSCPKDGLSREPLPGSAATAAWPATSSATLNRRRLRPPRHDPHHAQEACCKPLVINPNFPDGL